MTIWKDEAHLNILVLFWPFEDCSPLVAGFLNFTYFFVHPFTAMCGFRVCVIVRFGCLEGI